MNQLSNREPPKLPPGWKAQWDEEYQTFFYINERTGETQWELPTEDATGTATHSESKTPYLHVLLSTKEIMTMSKQTEVLDHLL